MPLADQGGGFRSGARLHDALDDVRAGTGGQFGQFLQGLLGLQSVGAPGAGARLPIQPDQDCPFGWRCSVRRFYASEASA